MGAVGHVHPLPAKARQPRYKFSERALRGLPYPSEDPQLQKRFRSARYGLGIFHDCREPPVLSTLPIVAFRKFLVMQRVPASILSLNKPSLDELFSQGKNSTHDFL